MRDAFAFREIDEKPLSDANEADVKLLLLVWRAVIQPLYSKL